MTVRAAVEAELAGQEGWQVEMAKALASEVDKSGSASAAKELRSLLADLGAAAVTGRPQKETGLSEFERRLRERESAPKTARRARSG